MPSRRSPAAVDDLLSALPLRALVAFAACWARTVQDRATDYFDRDADGGRRADAVRLAAVLAEQVAAGTRLDADEAAGVEEAVVEALMAVGAAASEAEDEDDATREAAFAANCAYAAIDAAAAADAAADADEPLDDARRVLVAATTGWEAAGAVGGLPPEVAVAVHAELTAQVSEQNGTADAEIASFPAVGPPIDFGRVLQIATTAREEAARAAEAPGDDIDTLRAELADAKAEAAALRAEAARAAETAEGPDADAKATDDLERSLRATYTERFDKLRRVVARCVARRAGLADLAIRLSAEQADLDRREAELRSAAAENEAESERLDRDAATHADAVAAFRAERERHEVAAAALREAVAVFDDATEPTTAEA